MLIIPGLTVLVASRFTNLGGFVATLAQGHWLRVGVGVLTHLANGCDLRLVVSDGFGCRSGGPGAQVLAQVAGFPAPHQFLWAALAHPSKAGRPIDEDATMKFLSS